MNKKKIISILMTLALLVTFAAPSYAAIINIVASDNNINYEYDATELNDSYTAYQIDPNSPDAKLYKEFMDKKPTAFLDDVRGYVDISDVNDAYTAAQLNNEKFDTDKYAETKAAKADESVVENLQTVTVKDGEVVIQPKEEPVDKVEVVEVSAINDKEPINVEFGTPVEELELPIEVEVTLSNEEKDVANIEWNTENYDPELAGEQVLNGTLVVPEGKEWTIPEDKLAVTVKVIVGEDTRVEVKEVKAVSETKIEVTFAEEAEVKEEDLKDAKVTLTAGEDEFTATYKVASLKDNKAEFVLDGEAELKDAVEYTVTADWATETTFVAKVADPYVAGFAKVTEEVPANVKEDGTNGNSVIALKGINQYGEDISLDKVEDVKLDATLNGMPLDTTTEGKEEAEYADGKVTVKVALKEGDKLSLTLTNKDGDKELAKSNIEYTIIKAEKAVVKSITLKADETSVEAGKTINLTADVRDQFNSPMKEEKVRWVVNGEVEEVENDNSQELALTKNTPGEYKVQVFSKTDSKIQAEITVTFGAKKLEKLTVGNTNENGKVKLTDSAKYFNNEELIVTTIKPNEGAALVAENIKFDIKSDNKDLTAEDITVKAEKVKSIDGKSEVIVVKAKTTKAGEFKVTPYVGEELTADKAIVGDIITIETEINPEVASISDIEFDAKELKVGQEIKKEIVFKNKHGEVLTATQAKATVTSSNEEVVKIGDKVIVQGTKETKDEDKTYLVVTPIAEGTTQLTVQSGDVLKTYTLAFVDVELAKIDAGGDIEGVVAGDATHEDSAKLAKYNEIKFLDQDGKEIKVLPDSVKSIELKVTGKDIDGNKINSVTGLAKLGVMTPATEEGKAPTFKEATAEENLDAKHVQILPTSDVKAGTYKVEVIAKVEVKGETEAKKVTASFNVEVGAARELKEIKVDPKTTDLGLGGKTTIKVNLVDQYGAPIKETVTATAKEGLTLGEVKQVKKGDKEVTGAYEFDVTADASGEHIIEVKVGEKTEKVTVNVKPAAELVETIAITGEGVKDGKLTHKLQVKSEDSQVIDLDIVGLDKDGNKINVKQDDVHWTSSNEKVATVDESGKVTAKGVKSNETSSEATITADLFGKKQEIVVVVSNEDPVAQEGTLKVIKDEKELEKLELTIDVDKEGNVKPINLTFVATDQYGNKDLEVEDFTILQSLNTEVVTVANNAGTVTITAGEKAGETTVRAVVGKDEKLIKVTVTEAAAAKVKADAEAADKEAAEKLAKAKAELKAAIDEAEAKIGTDEEKANYKASSVTNYEEAIKTAKEALNNKDATVETLTNAKTVLEAVELEEKAEREEPKLTISTTDGKTFTGLTVDGATVTVKDATVENDKVTFNEEQNELEVTVTYAADDDNKAATFEITYTVTSSEGDEGTTWTVTPKQDA